MSGKIEIDVRTIYELAGMPVPATPPTPAELEPLMRRQFAFLPQPIEVEFDGWKGVISHPQESPAARAEAARLGDKAAKKAAQGDHAHAIRLWKRALELEPSSRTLRRDLAMVCVETGNSDEAKNHLIEVLRFAPDDVWGLVVLGNLFKTADKDTAAAERFINRAVAAKPDDPWALNSLATIRMEQNRLPEALDLFSKAIAARPEFPNPHLGMGLALHNSGRADEAVRVIENLFARGQMQDARSQSVFDEARKFYQSLMVELAEKKHDDAFKAVEVMKRELQSLSGYPVRVQTGDVPGKLAAIMQMAWAHGRDHHLLVHRGDYPEHLLMHLIAHELGHLRLECAARKQNRNRILVATPANREKACGSMAVDVGKLRRMGLDDQTISDLTLDLASGMVRQVSNAPIDLLIERHIHSQYPDLRPSQFLSLQFLAMEAEKASTDPEVRAMTPRKVLLASAALNGATALFLDELWRGATNYAAAYRRLDSFPVSQRLFALVRSKADSLGPGEEYDLVDHFAEMLGLQGWYSWREDSGEHAVTSEDLPEGSSNPELLKQKQPVAVLYLLAALRRFSSLTVEQVRAISIEIALLGQTGLDYASPDQKYALESCPGEKFSGLQLMCMMHAGFAQFAPEHNTGMDLRDAFLAALTLFDRERKGQ